MLIAEKCKLSKASDNPLENIKTKLTLFQVVRLIRET